ncbi:MAG: hypothetical protein GY769_07875 [bacterium]|nr:hypothetical protein [bacterium]
MNEETAKEVMQTLCHKEALGGGWRDPGHVATTTISQRLRQKDWHFEYVALVELHLHRGVPGIDRFCGIKDITDAGIWFYDGDGHIDENCWRLYLIPWHLVTGMVVHQVS